MIGTTIGTLFIDSVASPKSGHRYYRVVCSCGRADVVRGSRLRDGSYQCVCQSSPKAERAPRATLRDTLSDVMAELKTLRRLVEALTPPKPALKPANLKIPRIRFTLDCANAGGGAVDERVERNRQALAAAEKCDPSVRDRELLRDRLDIEIEDAQAQSDPERLATARRQQRLFLGE